MPLEATGLAFIPACAADHFPLLGGIGAGAALIRVDGAPEPLDREAPRAARFARRRRMPSSAFDGDTLFTHDRRRARPSPKPRLDVWRIAVPPARGAETAHALAGTVWYADWAGGLFWVGTSQQRRSLVGEAASHRGAGGWACDAVARGPASAGTPAGLPAGNGGARGPDAGGQGRLRSAGIVQSRPHGRGPLMRTGFTPRATTGTGIGRGRAESSRLRPLRHLHGDLSDLCAVAVTSAIRRAGGSS